MLPNDVFKRPGRHHAYEADLASVAKLRSALDVLEALGLPEPLAAAMRCTTEEILEGFGASDAHSHGTIGDDFGLASYGPMLERAGLTVLWGGRLFSERDPRVEPISMFWADRRPYLPAHLAPAAEILECLGELRAPPEHAWQTLFDEMFDEDEEADRPPEERTPTLIARWRREYVTELDVLERHVREIAARGGSIVTWEDERGWL
jgi:hypothetical protein